MIGDRRYDALGARAVGIPAIGALWGYGDRAELTEAGADPIIASPRDIPDAVDDGVRAGGIAPPTCPHPALSRSGSETFSAREKVAAKSAG